MKFSLQRRHLVQGLAGGLTVAALPALAQSGYPDKPITMIVPYAAGGLTDNLGRMVGDHLSKAFGQTVVVENRPGAGTLLGANLVANAAPDGYTLMVVTTTTMGISPAMYKNNPFKLSDLTGVARIGDVTLLLITRPDFPAKNVTELVAALRAKPGQYSYASPGSGSGHHLLIEMLKAQENLQATHIPYKGSGQPLTDVMNGRVDFMFIDVSIGLPQVQAGKVKLLAVASAKRSSLMPDTPTLIESHPKLDLGIWQGLAAPARTPAAVLEKVNAEVNKMLAIPAVRERLVKVGVEPHPMSVAAFNEMIRKDAPRWAELVERSGAKAD